MSQEAAEVIAGALGAADWSAKMSNALRAKYVIEALSIAGFSIVPTFIYENYGDLVRAFNEVYATKQTDPGQPGKPN